MRARDGTEEEGVGREGELATYLKDTGRRSQTYFRRYLSTAMALTRYHTWDTARMVMNRRMRWRTSCAASVRAKRHEK